MSNPQTTEARSARANYPILQNKQIADGIFELMLEAPEMAAGATPGQFVNLYLPGGMLLLPRPVSIADADRAEGSVTLAYAVVGAGTQALSALPEGGVLDALGPLGVGFFDYAGSPLEKGGSSGEEATQSVFLVGGGAGIPPLRFAARRLREQLGDAVRIRAFLGFRGAPWYLREFEAFCDEGRCGSETPGAAPFHGNVVDLLKSELENDPFASFLLNRKTVSPRHSPLVLACGPRPMLAALSGFCAEQGFPLRVSLEERMGCGYGACASCTCRMRGVDRPTEGPGPSEPGGIVKKKVCAHGPVFWGEEVVW
ncbi:MAG: dihydroorotate dehydrogenase electron transfer subunit [Clostridiales bacterium]|nr:dihydroorotate dehydrogenase electron transfer subunit [Clostridiales bacterium]